MGYSSAVEQGGRPPAAGDFSTRDSHIGAGGRFPFQRLFTDIQGMKHCQQAPTLQSEPF